MGDFIYGWLLIHTAFDPKIHHFNICRSIIFPTIICLVSSLSALVFISWKKYKNHHVIVPNHIQHFNNSSHNENMFNCKNLFVIVICLCFFTALIISAVLKIISVNIPIFVAGYIIPSVILPYTYFILQPKYIQSVFSL